MKKIILFFERVEIRNSFNRADSSISELIPFTFDDVEDQITSFQNNELFVLESKGKTDPLSAYHWTSIFPISTTSWQSSFEQNNPLMLWDSPYAGSYLPKQDTFVSRLVRDSTIVAPTSFNSPQFTKSFLCQLVDDKTIGQVFKDARNFHYNGGSKSSSDNYIGLVLQSYALYGNPRQKIDMQWSESDLDSIRKYCKNYLDNLAPNIEFIEKIGNYSKFRKHVVFEIPKYNIMQVGNYSIINASPAYQNYEYGELVLPMAIRTTHFPINTLITNFSVTYIGDYVDLTIEDLPSYEFEFVNRTCYVDNESYSIDFTNAYTDFNNDFIAEIHPVEIINCTEGKFRLYKKFNYTVDYIALSPVLIEDIGAPLSSKINELINVKIKLMEITTDAENGSLAILDEQNNILWEKEIRTDETNHTASFYAPNNEGLQEYSIEFIQNNHTLAYNEFNVFITILEPKADIPVTVGSDPNIDIDLYSYGNFSLKSNYYLLDGEEIISQDSFEKQLEKGSNIQQLSFSGLEKEAQTYTLILELNYLNNKKSLAYTLNTNNPPLIFTDYNEDYDEGDLVIINVSTVDYDNDALDVTINDSRFTAIGNSFTWHTGYDDAGNYSVKITADDGLITTDKIINIEVKDVSLSPAVGLRAYYDFDEQGDIIYDSAGNNDGTLVSGVRAEGLSMKGIYFDGNNDYAKTPGIDLTDAITISAWVKPQKLNQHGYIVTKYTSYLLQLYTNNRFKAGIWYNGNWIDLVTSTQNISLGKWYHVAFTYDKHNMIIYVDGELENSVSYDKPMDHSNNDTNIGNREFDLTRDFKGVIDEVKIWDRALSADEVKGVYKERHILLELKPGWNLVSVPFEDYENPEFDSYGYPGNGYWVKKDVPENYVIYGNATDLTFQDGWNIVGYHMPIDVSVFNSTAVYTYNGSWQSYVAGRNWNSLEDIVPGRGYLVKK
jgi:hypothetical protein